MGEYLFGFIEQRKDSESDWRFVLPTSRIIGNDGGFRDVFSKYGNRFPKIPYKEGYPEDMSRETKALIAVDYRKGNIFINNEIGDYRVTSDKFRDAEKVIPRGLDSLESPHILDLGNHKKIIRDQDYARYFTFSDLEDIWNDELNDSAEKRIRKNAKDGGSIAREVENCIT